MRKQEIRHPEVKRRLPQCIIIGVRKAGTDALRSFLAIHPDIVAYYEEPHFFGKRNEYRKGTYLKGHLLVFLGICHMIIFVFFKLFMVFNEWLR